MSQNKNTEMEIKESLLSNDVEKTIKLIEEKNIDVNSFKIENKSIVTWLLGNLTELNEETIKNFKNNIIALHNKGLDLNQKKLEKDETAWFLEVLTLQDAELSSKFLKASNPEDRPWRSYQALLFTCQNDSPFSTLVDLVKDKHINVHDVNDQNENALFFAASQTDKWAEQRVFTLLHKGLDPNSRNNNGETPLFYSVNHGTVKATKILLTGYSDPNAVDLEGNTPLNTIEIKENMSEEAVGRIKNQIELLIESGAKLDIKNNQGISPLDKECFKDWVKWMVALEEKTKMESSIKEDFTKYLHVNKKAAKVG